MAGGKYHGEMSCPAISVVIATYNRSRALAHAIESVLGQTFTDWELIVVGDACTDDTAEIVARYVEADPRVRFVNLERTKESKRAEQYRVPLAAPLTLT
jgi:glycosyltransferase involved in cell wall biosynthesis